jgi:predicted MFS family arabinose efflux permease
MSVSTSSGFYKRYVLSALTLVCTFNYLDRCLLVLLLQPIKENLGLSDTQLGFLTGIAFALFYATLGIPIARWADRGNRSSITALAIALWGVTVMSCMWVTNFLQLVLARVAAGVGESGCMPPTYSLVGDYFAEPAERTRAMTVYWLASPMASLVSFMAGGWLNERFGWRLTFFLLGIPGLILAVVIKMTVAEPRVNAVANSRASKASPPLSSVLAHLWTQPSARHLSIGVILLFAVGSGLAPWYAAFMMRSHGMGTAELGLWLGLIFGVSGAIGIVSGGYVAERWFSHDEARQMRSSALSSAALAPCFVLFLLLPSKWEALIALIPLSMTFLFFMGPTFALLQRLVKDEMRATTLAVVMLLANLIGMGLGPQIVGILSDLMAPELGSDSLRYAMLAMSLVALWAAYHFWRASRTLRNDLEEVAYRDRSARAGAGAFVV